MNNDNTSLYKSALMQHFKQPYNRYKEPFAPSMITARGSNPRCGDDIEVGIEFTAFAPSSAIAKAGFRGRGCSVCLASASMMVSVIEGLAHNQALALSHKMQSWIDGELDDDAQIPEALHPLHAVKSHPARKKCVMLAWNALNEIIQQSKEDAA